MDELNRKPLQGVRSVVRFNWNFFAIALIAIILLTIAGTRFTGFHFAAALAVFALLLSLIATAHAYDFSRFYDLHWLDAPLAGATAVANIHSGFDETSGLLRARFPSIKLSTFDFYDPQKHTEASIRRARKAHPPDPETIAIDSRCIPLDSASIDVVLLTLAAHEIRRSDERVEFLREVRRVLKADGMAIVTEHLRDLPNLLAYNLGAWHFHTRSEWLANFEEAGLKVIEEQQRNLFITTFVLQSSEAPA